MKKLFIVLFAAAAVAACKQNPKTSTEAGQVAQKPEGAVTYTVDTVASSIVWHGSKVVTGSHTGTVQLKNGSFSFDGGQPKAGNFTIDMTTIKDTDLTDTAKNHQLVRHLSSADFFDVAKYPTATYEVTAVEKMPEGSEITHLMIGNLTIKGVTRGVTIPSKIAVSGNGLTASGKIEINRLEWNIMWGNENDKNARKMLQENFLSNMITLEINLVATK